MIIVSFATRDTHYQECADRLVESAKTSSMQLDMQVTEDGTPKDVGLRKPGFVLDMMKRHEGERICWMDADALITKKFHLPKGDWDVGLVPHFDDRLRKKNPMCAHFIAFQLTDAARRFLAVWKYLCDWPDMVDYFEHERMTWTREILCGEYKELDLSKYIRGALINNYGKSKEHRF